MVEIVGVWRLVAAEARDPHGAAVDGPYGPEPMGVIQFTPTRMMAVVGDGRTTLSEGAPPRFYLSYSGPWRFDGSTLVTSVEHASDPARMGTEQVRSVQFRSQRMVLSPPPRLVQGIMTTLELSWEKLA